MLFGQQNNVDQSSTQGVVVSSDGVSGMNPLAVDPATGASLPAVPSDSAELPDVIEDLSVLDQPTSSITGHTSGLVPMPEPASNTLVSLNGNDSSDALPSAATTTAPSLDATSGASDVAGHESAHIPQVVLSSTTSSIDDTPPDPATDDLLDLKQQAIAQLSPLLGQLDQTPEEKFRTTMMLIQTTDNPGLLHAAYSAAQAIPDEKSRAQAFLDVVNEINYFTQQQDTQSS